MQKRTCFLTAMIALSVAFTASSALAMGGVVNGIQANAIVAQDGSGDFKTVQSALDAVPQRSTIPFVILVKPGTYTERVIVPRLKFPLVLRGESPAAADTTIIRFHRAAAQLGTDGKPFGTSHTASLEVDADNFSARDLTVENTAGEHAGQAVALMAKGDQDTFFHCRFLGWQDTLYLTGHTQRQYLQDCTIQGSVDFIFGYGTAALVGCRILSKAPGCITAQARLSADSPTGFVFQNCVLQVAPGVADGSVFLGRPWRPYSRVVFLHCTLAPQINPAGWRDWSQADTDREKTAFYAEYDDQTPGGQTANITQRVAWSRQLTAAQAAQFAPATFLKDADRWNPQATAHEPERH